MMLPKAAASAATFAALFAFTATTSLAQTLFPVAYPQATTTESSGNLVPLGFSSSSGNFDESRYQLLIPSTHLPTTPCDLVGIEVNCHTYTGAITYDELILTLSNTTATSLSSSFASNLPSPVQVFSGQQVPVNYTRRTWELIRFSQPFRHDGTSALTIDFRKKYDRIANPPPTVITMETSGNDIRDDLPRAIASFSTFGGGASSSTTAGLSYSGFLKVRLRALDVPTLELNGDRGGSHNKVFSIGGTAEFRVHAPQGSAYLVFTDSAFTPAIPLPPVNGSLILQPLVILTSGATGAGDVGTLTANIPNFPFLEDAYLAFQALAVQNGTPYFTNGADVVIN